MSNPPRLILAVLSTALFVLFFASLIYQEMVPNQILGVDKIFWQIFLIIGAIAANWGGKFLDWLRRRN